MTSYFMGIIYYLLILCSNVLSELTNGANIFDTEYIIKLMTK